MQGAEKFQFRFSENHPALKLRFTAPHMRNLDIQELNMPAIERLTSMDSSKL
jgi:hypothetical protein